MPVAGGPKRHMPWRTLACSGALTSPPTLVQLLPGRDGHELLALTLRCSGRTTRLVVVTDSTGNPLSSFGVTGASVDVEMARLRPGHKPLIQLPGNVFVAQVQFAAAPRPHRSVLPRVQRFGASPAARIARGAWLFSRRGRPLHALFGPGLKVAARVGLAEVWPASSTSPAASGSSRMLWQLLVGGGRRNWRIDRPRNVLDRPASR